MFRDLGPKLAPIPRPQAESFFQYAKSLGCEELHIKFDPETGLNAIIVIHSTERGPALGGCRLYEYETADQAVEDAIRLARGMTYKAAIGKLNFGGGKAVIMKPKIIKDREAFFRSFGRFVEELGGKYIPAMDIGTTEEDMDAIAKETKYVSSTSGTNGDPSPYTAIGLKEGLETAMKFKLGKESLAGIHVAIQGLGHVGYNLVKELSGAGAIITGADINTNAIEHAKKDFDLNIVEPSEIHKIDCDVFSPCAMGSALTEKIISEIKAPIVAGSSNNQLANDNDGIKLHEKGILYAPDYVINAGGIMYASGRYTGQSVNEILDHIHHIPKTLETIFEKSKSEGRATSEVADEMAVGG